MAFLLNFIDSIFTKYYIKIKMTGKYGLILKNIKTKSQYKPTGRYKNKSIWQRS